MPTIQYEMTYSRTIDVEVTDEELKALRVYNSEGYPTKVNVTREDLQRWDAEHSVKQPSVELATLHHDGQLYKAIKNRARACEVRQAVVDRAIAGIPKKADGCNEEPEWVMSTCTYEPEGGELEELFDVG